MPTSTTTSKSMRPTGRAWNRRSVSTRNTPTTPDPPFTVTVIYVTEAETEGRAGTSYHAIREHETVKIDCTRCHTAHTTDSDAGSRFIAKARVRPVCGGCHKEL